MDDGSGKSVRKNMEFEWGHTGWGFSPAKLRKWGQGRKMKIRE